jgi:cysteine synthase
MADKKARFDSGTIRGVATVVQDSRRNCEVVIVAPSQAALEHFLNQELPRTVWDTSKFQHGLKLVREEGV